MAETLNYRKYFAPGKRIGISIPLADGKFFNEWGTIWAFDEEDLLEFQLSRDLLPADVKVEVGTILELKTEASGIRYSCRGIIVDSDGPSRYFIRIIGEVILDEEREFYRLDVFLPLTLARLDGVTADEALRRWQERKNKTAEEKPADTPERQQQPHPELHPLAANISGGGLRVKIPDELKVDDLVDLQLHVPSSSNTKETVVDVVGQVVYVHATAPEGSPHRMFSTAIRFLHIEERDRDQVIKFISWEQLQRIRQLRERYYREEEAPRAARRGYVERVRKVLVFIAIAALIGFLGDSLMRYHAHHEKSEIHKIFEKGLRDYISKHKPYF